MDEEQEIETTHEVKKSKSFPWLWALVGMVILITSLVWIFQPDYLGFIVLLWVISFFGGIIGFFLRRFTKEPNKYEDEEKKEHLRTFEKDGENTKIFIIHGHDEGTKEKVARFLMQMNLDPIILHEKPNEGKTIIEKFEKHSLDVGFAIALLTPDDVGNSRVNEKNLTYRARQNVILELGYFIGKLGRKRVCALLGKDVEIPSDYSGILYIPLEEETWKFNLAKELKNAGFKIDMNKVI